MTSWWGRGVWPFSIFKREKYALSGDVDHVKKLQVYQKTAWSLKKKRTTRSLNIVNEPGVIRGKANLFLEWSNKHTCRKHVPRGPWGARRPWCPHDTHHTAGLSSRVNTGHQTPLCSPPHGNLCPCCYSTLILALHTHKHTHSHGRGTEDKQTSQSCLDSAECKQYNCNQTILGCRFRDISPSHWNQSEQVRGETLCQHYQQQ